MQILSVGIAAVQPISAPRRATGAFARQADPRAVQPVKLADGREGFRVGPRGRIYRDRPAALDFARSREARLARFAALGAMVATRGIEVDPEGDPSFAEEVTRVLEASRPAPELADEDRDALHPTIQDDQAREAREIGTDGPWIDGDPREEEVDQEDREWAANNLNDERDDDATPDSYFDIRAAAAEAQARYELGCYAY